MPVESTLERKVSPVFLVYYDPDKKRHARQKLQEAIDRYVLKFGTNPAYCLTSVQDAADLALPSRKWPVLSVEVLPRAYVARYTMYLGEESA